MPDVPTQAARVTIVLCGLILFLAMFIHVEQQHRRYCRFHAEETQCSEPAPAPLAME